MYSNFMFYITHFELLLFYFIAFVQYFILLSPPLTHSLSLSHSFNIISLSHTLVNSPMKCTHYAKMTSLPLLLALSSPSHLLEVDVRTYTALNIDYLCSV